MMHNYRFLFAFLFFFVSPLFAGDEEKKEPDIAYFEVKPSLVSNLNGGPKYLRCDVQLMVEFADKLPQIELHVPAIRNELLMLALEQDGKALLTPDGKESFRKAALEAIRKLLNDLTGKSLVDDLYFSTFYVK